MLNSYPFSLGPFPIILLFQSNVIFATSMSCLLTSFFIHNHSKHWEWQWHNRITDAPKHLFFIPVVPPGIDSRLSVSADAKLWFVQAATFLRSPHCNKAFNFCHQGHLFHRHSWTGGIIACLAKITISPFGSSATNSTFQMNKMSLWLSNDMRRCVTGVQFRGHPSTRLEDRGATSQQATFPVQDNRFGSPALARKTLSGRANLHSKASFSQGTKLLALLGKVREARDPNRPTCPALRTVRGVIFTCLFR